MCNINSSFKESVNMYWKHPCSALTAEECILLKGIKLHFSKISPLRFLQPTPTFLPLNLSLVFFKPDNQRSLIFLINQKKLGAQTFQRQRQPIPNLNKNLFQFQFTSYLWCSGLFVKNISYPFSLAHINAAILIVFKRRWLKTYF